MKKNQRRNLEKKAQAATSNGANKFLSSGAIKLHHCAATGDKIRVNRDEAKALLAMIDSLIATNESMSGHISKQAEPVENPRIGELRTKLAEWQADPKSRLTLPQTLKYIIDAIGTGE